MYMYIHTYTDTYLFLELTLAIGKITQNVLDVQTV